MTYLGKSRGDDIYGLVSVSGEFPTFVPNNPPRHVVVSPFGDGDFTAVKAAVESITDAVSNTNEYVVEIKAGYFRWCEGAHI